MADSGVGTKVTAIDQQAGASDYGRAITVQGKGNVTQQTESLGVAVGARGTFSGTLLQPGANQSILALGENSALTVSADESLIDTTLSRTAEILAGFSNRTADSEAALEQAYRGTTEKLGDALALNSTGGLSLVKPIVLIGAGLLALYFVIKAFRK